MSTLFICPPLFNMAYINPHLTDWVRHGYSCWRYGYFWRGALLSRPSKVVLPKSSPAIRKESRAMPDLLKRALVGKEVPSYLMSPR